MPTSLGHAHAACIAAAAACTSRKERQHVGGYELCCVEVGSHTATPPVDRPVWPARAMRELVRLGADVTQDQLEEDVAACESGPSAFEQHFADQLSLNPRCEASSYA